LTAKDLQFLQNCKDQKSSCNLIEPDVSVAYAEDTNGRLLILYEALNLKLRGVFYVLIFSDETLLEKIIWRTIFSSPNKKVSFVEHCFV